MMNIHILKAVRFSGMLLLIGGVCLGMSGCENFSDVFTSPDSPKQTENRVAEVSAQDKKPEEEGLVISDPLINGSSTGQAYGGVFTPDGFKVISDSNGYLAYETGIYDDIRIEFDARGYVPVETNGDGKIVIMQVFDSRHDFNWLGEEPWYSEYSMYEIRKRGTYHGQILNRTDGLHLKCGGEGNNGLELGTWIPGNSPAGHPLEWDPSTTYHWVVTLKDGFTEIIRNGQTIFAVQIDHVFSPENTLNIRIGGTWFGRVGPGNVTYSNIKIYAL